MYEVSDIQEYRQKWLEVERDLAVNWAEFPIKGVIIHDKPEIDLNKETFTPRATFTLTCEVTPKQAQLLTSGEGKLNIYIVPGKSESKKPGPRPGSHHKRATDCLDGDPVTLTVPNKTTKQGVEGAEKPPVPPEMLDTKGEAKRGTNKGRIVVHEPPRGADKPETATGKDTDWREELASLSENHYLDPTPMTEAEKGAARKEA